MTLQEKTLHTYSDFADEYIQRAEDVRTSAQDHNVWWKPRIKKHWLFLMSMGKFYIDNVKYQLK